MISGSSAFILLANSKQATPSPMSHRAAEPFFRSAAWVELEIGQQHHALGRSESDKRRRGQGLPLALSTR